MTSIFITPGISGKKPVIEQPGVETFQRFFPQDPGKFCTLFSMSFVLKLPSQPHARHAQQPNINSLRQSRYKSYQTPTFDQAYPLQSADLTGSGQQTMNDCYI
jgi:hypothetical protein